MKVVYKRILPVLAGAGLGFAYYYFIGCYNGTCVISSNPYISTVYGGLIGYLFTFPSKKKKEEKVNENN
ncbi:MAG: hypothetical protein GXO85_02660 [Chlorobi bacterium]|nr:hypothetical protein [Chlorobiota bacterium]